MMVIRSFVRGLGAIIALAVLPCHAVAAPVDQKRLAGAEAGSDWLSYGRTWSEQRFSPIAQVDSRTVKRLGLAWWTEFDTDRGQEATPLEADGVLYTSTAWSKVFAFDARTGRALWSFDPHVPGQTALAACCDVVNRGVALWDSRVYVGTLDGRLIALDRTTGRQVWSVQTTDKSRPYTITGAPRVVDGLVLIGNGGAELGVRGYLSAYNADTGKLAWRFYMTPNPDGKPDHAASDPALATKANATWFGNDWKQSGGGGTPWDAIVYDAQTDLLIVGTGNGSPWNHYIRSQGKGDNLFLSSIVALKPKTGQYVWHYQTTPGDSWDYTATQPIMTADLTIRGQKHHVVMQAPKNGFFYVLDAATGKLLSADKYAPWVDWASRVDMATGRPVERPGVRWGNGLLSTQNPGPIGAHSWKPMAFDPKTGLVFIPAQDAVFSYRGAPNPQDFHVSVGVWNLGTGVQGVAGNGQASKDAIAQAAASAARQAGMPKPPSATSRSVLVAWDPVARKARWSIARQSVWGSGGTLATAGGLVFQGVDHSLEALSTADGKTLWSYDMGAPAIAAPISYALDGVQYVAVMLGNGGGASTGDGLRPGRLMVFKLDGAVKATPFSTAFLPPIADVAKAEASQGDPVAGGVLFRRYCTICHGSSNLYPDLHRSAVPLHKDQFAMVVHDGALQAGGMASFQKYLSRSDVESIRAYLITDFPALLPPSKH